MKKVIGVFVFLLVGVSFVSALDLADGLGRGSGQVVDIIQKFLTPFFTAIFGGENDMLFERVLFLTIILAIVYVVIGEIEIFKGNTTIVWIVSVSVSLLSTRFLGEAGLIDAMLLPYSVLGIALTCVIPFLIYFTFVYKFQSTGSDIIRRFMWALFAIIYFGIWGARNADAGGWGWIYLLTAGASFLSFVFDGTIRDTITRRERALRSADTKETHLAEIRKELGELIKNRGNYTNVPAYNRLLKNKIKELKRVEKAKF